jgi:hypothetical protein
VVPQHQLDLNSDNDDLTFGRQRQISGGCFRAIISRSRSMKCARSPQKGYAPGVELYFDGSSLGHLSCVFLEERQQFTPKPSCVRDPSLRLTCAQLMTERRCVIPAPGIHIAYEKRRFLTLISVPGALKDCPGARTTSSIRISSKGSARPSEEWFRVLISYPPGEAE